MTVDEVVELATKMRAAGVQEFRFENLSCKLAPPEKGKVSELADRIGELSLEERTALIEDTKRELEADMYGASR